MCECNCCCKVVTGVIFSIVGVIVLIVLIVCSFHVVEVGEYGIDIDGVTQSVDLSAIYDSGRHFTGIGHYFAIFPQTLSSISFSGADVVTARTHEGLPLSLCLTLQYQLIPSEIPQLWRTFFTNYTELLKSVVRDVVRDVAAQYQAVEYFHNRTVIESAMSNAVAYSFSRMHANSSALQLTTVELPDTFVTAILNTELARQAIDKAVNDLKTAIPMNQQTILQAQTNATSRVTVANATAQALVVAATATAQALAITYNAAAISYQALEGGIGLSPDELITYLYIDALNMHDPRYLTYSLDPPSHIGRP